MRKVQYTKGFSLVELMVALALFGFVVIIASGTLSVISGSNLSAQISRKTIDNIDFVLDDIVREARLGKDFHCVISPTNDYDDDRNPVDCSRGASSFALTQIGTGDLVRYSTSTIGEQSVIIKEVVQGGTNTVLSKTQLTAEGIDISSLRFYVSGSQDGDSIPSQVLVTLKAELKKGSRYSTTVDLQTTIAQRAPDS